MTRAVALACSGLGHVRRGNETWARSVAEALHSDGERVTLFGGGTLGVHCPYQRVWNLPRETWGLRRCFSWARRYALEQQTFAWSLQRRLRRDPYDIAHVADPVLAYRLKLALARGNRHLIYQDGLFLGSDWCRRFDCVQVLAPYYRDQAVAEGVNVERWFVIPQLVDPTRFAPPADRAAVRSRWFGQAMPPEAFVVLAVGDFSPGSNKRLEWLVEEVIRMGRDAAVHLVVAGQASDTDLPRFLAMQHRLPGRLHLQPNVPLERMPELYQAADVFAHAALREPFGIVFIEAMASGLAVLGHHFPVTSWIIGDGGEAIDMTQPGDLAQTLAKWHAEPALREERAARARERAVSQFAPQRIVPLYRQMYASLRAA
jgi:1,2-diacylglycerol 3-alpha-glucosyltransferase